MSWLDKYSDETPKAQNGIEGTMGGLTDKGFDYNGAWGGQFQDGGKKKPIYVESKNDPRYIAYQDSLSLYNNSEKGIKNIPKQSIQPLSKDMIEEWMYSKIQPIGQKKDKQTNYKGETVYPVFKKPEQPVIVKPTTTKKTTKPKSNYWTDKDVSADAWKKFIKRHPGAIGMDPNNVDKDGYHLPIYADKKRDKLIPIQNNLQPEDVVSNFDIEASTPITRREFIAPKYYNVEDVVNRGKSQTNYKWYPGNQDVLRELSEEAGDRRTMTPVYQNGGKTFLQPTSDKLPEGYRIPFSNPSTELAMSIGGENGEPAYLIPSFKYGRPLADPILEFRNTGEHLGGPFKTWQEADEWERTVRHPAVENRETIMFPQEKFQTGGSMPGAVGFTYARTQGIPSEGPYAKKTMPSAQNGQEMKYYQKGLDWRPKTISREGSVIKDDRGQWAHPGEITEINSNDITMEGVPYPVLGISDTGDNKLMKPGKNYKFKGKKVIEFPMAKNGINDLDAKPLQKLDNLLNFTNYNKPTGWLDKY